MYRRRRVSDFQKQLREKQKLRRIYGVMEAQFRRYYESALKKRGMTGQALLEQLEQRLDNVVYRLGYAASRNQARQLVTHGHFNINGRRTNVPSTLVSPGDEISVRDGSRKRPYFKDLAVEAETRTVPEWLERDLDNLSGRMLQMPARSDIEAALNEQLVVEYYSR
jgi:small subunit ribosomal protein S4